MAHLTGNIGRKTLKFVDHILSLFAFTCRILILIFKRPESGRVLVRRITLEQIYFTCVESLPIIIPIALIIGCILIIQFSRV
jgi:phospholipid/cholesterol/gamma-HCH transport system permease protein